MTENGNKLYLILQISFRYKSSKLFLIDFCLDQFCDFFVQSSKQSFKDMTFQNFC